MIFANILVYDKIIQSPHISFHLILRAYRHIVSVVEAEFNRISLRYIAARFKK